MSVLGLTSVQAGVGILPAVCLMIPTAAVVALLVTRCGQFQWAIWSGLVITTVACGLFVILGTHTSSAIFAFIMALFGIGNGMVLTSVNVGIQAMAVDDDPALAASMYGFMRSLGMPIGVAVRYRESSTPV